MTTVDRDSAPFYAVFNGATVFVKEGNFFRSQGGLTQAWGRSWVPVAAASIGDARRQYAAQIGHTLTHLYAGEK